MLETLSLQTLGDRIRWARLRLQPPLSAKEVARLAGVAPSVIWNAEGKRGKSGNCTIRKITEVAKVLQVDAEWLATGKGTPFLSVVAEPDGRADYLAADDAEVRMMFEWLETWRNADQGDRSVIEVAFSVARKRQQSQAPALRRA